MKPANNISLVQRLAADEQTCSFFAPVLTELRRHGLDSDDLRAIIQPELGETHCFKSKPTEKYHPQTISDHYTIWIDECQHRMFIKLLERQTFKWNHPGASCADLIRASRRNPW